MLLSVAKWLPFPGSDGGGGAGRIKESTRLRGSWVMGVGPPLSHPPLTLTHSVRAHVRQLVSFLNKPVLLTHRSMNSNNSNNNCVVVLLRQREATCHFGKSTEAAVSLPRPPPAAPQGVWGSHSPPATEDPTGLSLSGQTCPFSKHIP